MSYIIDGWEKIEVPVVPVLDETLNFYIKDDIQMDFVDGSVMPGGSLKFLGIEGLIESMQEACTIWPGDRWVEASSGRTANAMVRRARQYGISCTFVMKSDVPGAKSGAPRVAGARVISPDPERSGIFTARRIGGGGWTGKGWGRDGKYVNPDQYAAPGMLKYYEEWLVPKILDAGGEFDVLVVPVGTGSTIAGLSDGLRSRFGDSIMIVGVMCKDIKTNEIPGVRDLISMREIFQPWEAAADDIQYVTRKPSFLCVPWIDWLVDIPAGPSGAATYVAGCHLAKRIVADPVLREKILKGKKRRTVKMRFIVHDDYYPYVGDRFFSEFGEDNFHISTATPPKQLIFG